MPSLSPELLRWTCDPLLPELGSAEPRAQGSFGQPRALSALHLGLEISSPGYNIFVTGPQGSGRMSSIRDLLQTIGAHAPATLFDLVYVNNFDDPSRPVLLRLPSGRARPFQIAIGELVAAARSRIAALFDSDSFRAERDAMIEKTSGSDQEKLDTFRKKIQKDGLDLVLLGEDTETGPELCVIVDGRPVHPLALRTDGATANAWIQAVRAAGAQTESKTLESSLDAIEAKYAAYSEELAGIVRSSRRTARTVSNALRGLEEGKAEPLIRELVAEVDAEFPYAEVHAYLGRVARHIVAHLDPFKSPVDEDAPRTDQFTTPASDADDTFAIYAVNVLHDTTGSTGRPIVFELNPTFTNVVGTIDVATDAEGGRQVDFRGIRCGALIRACGGYLVMYASDVLAEPGVWRTLVRALRARRLEIQWPEAAVALHGPGLKPEPVPLDVKVILVGDEQLFEVLDAEDDFRKTFKVKAEFDTSVENNRENIGCFGAALRNIADREGLGEVGAGAIAVLAEYASRAAGSKKRLSTRFGDLADLVREAGFWSKRRAPAGAIDAGDMMQAIAERRSRHDLADVKLDELIRDGLLVIETSGSAVGQINALAVYGAHPHYFGRAQRITVAAGVGREGLVNIEREAHLSGSTYDKAVFILAGYLRRKYGARRRLSVTASIAFEQSYAEVDGDSASLAELYCLLSAIAESPIAAGIAVTGSVDQLGGVQAVGGVNEKIEAFFKTCRSRGLTGVQGCIIPKSNIDSLMLDREVVAACREGSFSVHAIEQADEGIRALFGMSADDLHARVSERLKLR